MESHEFFTRRAQSDGNLTYFDDIRKSNATIELKPGSAVQRVNESFRLGHVLSMFTADMSDFSLLGVCICRAGRLSGGRAFQCTKWSGDTEPEIFFC